MTDTAEISELITAGPAKGLAALLDQAPIASGDELPLLWHWVYLLDKPAQSVLGADGHRASGGVPTPPAAGLRRMFGGGRVHQRAPLVLGLEATRRTSAGSTERKHGRSGDLVLVTVISEIEQGGRICIIDEQKIIYRYAGPAPAGQNRSETAQRPEPPSLSPGQHIIAIDAVVLFRFSALTFNSHRIHYDREYATGVEGYPGLLVHGPLQALLMAEATRASRPDGSDRVMTYRLEAPLFDHQGLVVATRAAGLGFEAEVTDFAGRRTASAQFS